MKKTVKGEDGKEYTMKEKKPFYKKVWFWALVVIIIIAIASQGNKKPETTVNGEQTKAEESANKTEKKEETKEPEKPKYELTQVKQESDEFSTYVTGVLKNNSGSDKGYIQIEFPVYDKDGNKLDSAFANVTELKKDKTWKFKAVYLGTEKDVKVDLKDPKVSGF
ncbi:FxLYD domain-containing protein [Finegoldia magna]|uniref:FxLYD domain-containing protein n=1 Tax=Finegoldia magna TaxID=1260 RepID=UPI000763E046|nr:FxLYD domain-containing protein [Finegoldia magna]KXA07722.1 hypothetical protein HMPREF3217_01704 [Finegoldia magna]